jgi:molybdopterin-containing oxidoreductase family iron-sulfur binding subunit
VNKTYWRSLNELENKDAFLEALHREFPDSAAEYPEGVSRRRWLQLMGASLALGGLTGCWKKEEVLPQISRPANRTPGVAVHYATAREHGGFGEALLLQSYDGRPIKVEGNLEHPASLGKTSQFAQASILDLYDPDRADGVILRSEGRQEASSWEAFEKEIKPVIGRTENGGGIAVLAESTSSLSFGEMKRRFLEMFPSAIWHEYESLSRDNEIAGSVEAFGQAARPHWNLDQIDVWVVLDADPLRSHPDSVRVTRQFADRRVPDNAQGMIRLYALESQFTTTGANADHRLPVRSGDMAGVLATLEAHLEEGLANPDVLAAKIKSEESRAKQILLAAAHDLVTHKGKSLVTIGPGHAPGLHARVHRINAILENIGKTVTFTEEPMARPQPHVDSLKSLVDAMNAKKVATLIILGGNPVYSAPADIDFAGALKNVDHCIRLGLYDDETATACHWSLPAAHPYETWGDTRTYNGTVTLVQPLIAPLLGGRSAIELLAMLIGDVVSEVSAEKVSDLGQRIVRRTIQGLIGTDENAWLTAVERGFIDQGVLSPAQVSIKAEVKAGSEKLDSGNPGNGQLELVFTESSHTYDGRYANNGWLLETPDFITKLVWDNVAAMGPDTAKDLGVEDSTLVTLTVGGKSVEIPAFIVPGLAYGSVGVALGFGRSMAGVVGGYQPAKIETVGVNIGKLRTSHAMSAVVGLEVKRTGKKARLATTQEHFAIETAGSKEVDRRSADLIREANLSEYREHPDFAQHMVHAPPLVSLWKHSVNEGYKWGMSIDLARCVGCNACVTACQSENNIPIVGKDQISRSREMHWIRVDRYYRGDWSNPEVVYQPLPCQQCENAPCEQVCPVNATVHSTDGLNDMVYNRCIGTRYCANNCPYKVRRFNYMHWTGYLDQAKEGNEILRRMVLNPDVTVRTRGVMEKCTYCVQRIHREQIPAKNEQRPIPDGAIQTACQQACPADAIVFGDLSNKDSRVAKMHADARTYSLLGEINSQPRTKYLAKIRNPHPSLAEPRLKSHGHGGHDDGHGHEHGDHDHDHKDAAGADHAEPAPKNGEH